MMIQNTVKPALLRSQNISTRSVQPVALGTLESVALQFQGNQDKTRNKSSLTYVVKATPQEVLATLQTEMDLMPLDYKSTQGGRTMRGKYKNNKGFVGEIQGDTFRVMTKRWYNNASAPVLEAVIGKNDKGETTVTTRIDRLPSGKNFLKAYYGLTGVASMITLPILLAQSLTGVPEVAAIVGLTAPLWSMGILYCTETPLTRKESKALNGLMDKLFGPRVGTP